MNLLKNIKAVSFAALAAIGLNAHAQSQQNNVIDEVVWVVGDEAILKSDVEMAKLEGQSRGQSWDGDPYCVIPEQLAVQKLFLHQAAIDSISITDSEVMQSVDQRIQYYIQQLGTREKMEEFFGKTMTQIREQLFDLVRDDQLTSEVRSNLVQNIKVTPAQVRNYFKDMPEDSIPFIPTKLEVQILQRNPVIEQEEIDRVKAELRDYTERVNSGQSSFSTLALLYSEDKESAKRGGELGLSGRMDFVPEFSNVAFNLTDPKTVSKIFETEFGFHIVQIIEKRGDMINCRHILRKPRVSDEALTKLLGEMDSVADEIRRAKYTFDDAAGRWSQDKDTRNNYGIMVNRDGTPKFEMKDLPTEVARAVSGMNVGEVSKPFVMIDKTGKEVVAIVKLRNKVNGHRATMADDYQELQNVVLEKLSEEKIEKWIRDKQKTTYIRVNEDWRNCEFKYPGWIKE